MKSLLNLNIVNLRNDLNNVKSLTRKNIEDGQNFIKKEFEDQKKKKSKMRLKTIENVLGKATTT